MISKELEFALIAGKSALILAADDAGKDSIAGDRCRKSATVIQEHIDSLSTPPSAAQVKPWAYAHKFETAWGATWHVGVETVNGQQATDSMPLYWGEDVDALARQMDGLTAERDHLQQGFNAAVLTVSLLESERDALKARVEALEFAMQTAINEIHYDDDSAAAERTLRKALTGDRP
jgi:hypothetical protein